MGDVVNLRHARKTRARTAAEAVAAVNRAKFGRTKAEREADRAEADRARKAVDAAELDDCAPSPNPSTPSPRT